ncbi:MAG: hypothetical protein AB7O04_15020 [Hyphomonadaceae bacterium]
MNASDHFDGSAALKDALGAALGALAIVVLAIITLAATFVGVLIALAVFSARLIAGARRKPARGPMLLEARRTPTGWVAEP